MSRVSAHEIVSLPASDHSANADFIAAYCVEDEAHRSLFEVKLNLKKVEVDNEVSILGVSPYSTKIIASFLTVSRLHPPPRECVNLFTTPYSAEFAII